MVQVEPIAQLLARAAKCQSIAATAYMMARELRDEQRARDWQETGEYFARLARAYLGC